MKALTAERIEYRHHRARESDNLNTLSDHAIKVSVPQGEFLAPSASICSKSEDVE